MQESGWTGLSALRAGCLQGWPEKPHTLALQGFGAPPVHGDHRGEFAGCSPYSQNIMVTAALQQVVIKPNHNSVHSKGIATSFRITQAGCVSFTPPHSTSKKISCRAQGA
jgi:hypothetical protein